MSDRHHYVSQFHLREFTDLLVEAPLEPWLWVGDPVTRTIERRSPKNLAWSRGLYDGPGGLADRRSSLETFMAQKIETPAATALRTLLSRPVGQRAPIPAALGRYLAWAAARSVSMRQLYQHWLDDSPDPAEIDYAESPPEFFEKLIPRARTHSMEHSSIGVRHDVPSDEVMVLRRKGWRLVLGPDDFLELLHLQAGYFEVRFFPRLQWVILEAPPGDSFVIGDRPVVWGFEGHLTDPPNALRNPKVQLVAPLSRSTALFAYHASSAAPSQVHAAAFNRIVALAATDWVAGPTRDSVARSLTVDI